MASYLITQATGQQSQAVIKHLLAAGLKVHAVVRDAQKIPAALKSPGVTIFQGDSTNFDEIYRAAQGCKGAFLNTFPIPGLEAQQAKTIAEASKKAGVEFIVAATTFLTGDRSVWDDDATKECGLHEYYVSKAAIEDAVRQTFGDKAYTILRPAFIHHDYFLPSVHHNFPELATHRELAHCFDEGSRMPHTDADDIGKYALAAFQDPAKFGGQGIDLGNEALTIEEVRDILVRVTGRDVTIRKRSPEEAEKIRNTVMGQRFHFMANVKDFSAIAATAEETQAKFGIPFTPFEQSMQKGKARLLECIPA
ncbi:NmrA family protein [Hypomontagnella submonticulosa]|nr:NmrA family protein [Hypomontagnella submonticulosa]